MKKKLFKVYDFEGDLRGSTVFIQDALALVAYIGQGAVVRHGSTKSPALWTEGTETFAMSIEPHDIEAGAELVEDRIRVAKEHAEKLAAERAAERVAAKERAAKIREARAAHKELLARLRNQ